MKKYLIASGCSFTGNHNNSNVKESHNVPFTRWPAVLAEKLGMIPINLGYSGVGNDAILYHLVEEVSKFNVEDIGLILVGWTSPLRTSVYDSPGSHWHGYQYHPIITSNRLGSFDVDKKVVKKYNIYFYKRMAMQQVLFAEFCKSLMVDFKQFQMLWKPDDDDYQNFLSDSDQRMPKGVQKTFIKRDSLFGNFPNPDERISPDDWHPNEKGHYRIASILYDNL